MSDSPSALRDRVQADYGLTRLEFREYPGIQGLEIEMIRVAEVDRGQGRARRALEDIIEWAEETGTTLYLTPDPVGRGLSKTALTRFYRGLGFVKRPSGHGEFQVRNTLMREPAARARNPAVVALKQRLLPTP